jgi:hypothetical protein
MGQMSRVVLSILRQTAEPLTSRDIALEVLVSRAMDKRDQRLLRLMTKRVGVALRTQREKWGCPERSRAGTVHAVADIQMIRPGAYDETSERIMALC